MAVFPGPWGPKHPQTSSNIPNSAPYITYMHCYQSHVPSIWPQNRSKPSRATHKHYKAHVVPFRRSNMAVFRARGGQNTIKMHQTYQKVLHISPICIATSHMFHPLGLEIAQNRPKPPTSTIRPILCLSGRAIWPFSRARGGQNTLKMHQTYPKVLHIPPICIATSHMFYPLGLEIAQNRPKSPTSTRRPILCLSGRAIWPFSGPVEAKTPSKCIKHTR
jgi:hypothetical protein